MKYVVFSDTHLGEGFNEKKFVFLKKIINGADRIIIAGDFWEGLQITFDEFVNSRWNKLFPYLKKKKAVYIYGNHDSKKYNNERVSLFSVIQTERYVFSSGNKTFVVEHGDRAHILAVTLTKNVSKMIAFFINKNPMISHQLEKFAFNIFGKDFHQKISSRMNNKIKNQLGKGFAGNRILICGHSHHQELDLKNNFVNPGMIKFGLGQYFVIENGRINLREEWYNRG